MDIISRLRFFMDSSGLQSSQFADTCKIPRPTLSQLLNGRNKKVSDEIIAKVHSGFPELNVLWLLFGEGSMYLNSNDRFSEPENAQIPHPSSQYHTDSQDVIQPKEPNIFAGFYNQSGEIPREGEIGSFKEINENDTLKNNPNNHSTNEPANVLIKKITSILVFYDDNSFESFVPSSDFKS